MPIVVTGFEPLDILQGVYMCVEQLESGRAEVENQYTRSVRRGGNEPAQQLIREVFRVVPRKWRGVGEIARSGLSLSDVYADFDAERRFGVAGYRAEESSECISGLILQGLKKPHECPAFGTRCAGASAWCDDGFERGRVRCLYRYRGPQASVMSEFVPACPLPMGDYSNVLLAHGGGGRLMHQLIEKLMLPAFGNAILGHNTMARSSRSTARGLPTTDSYVVRPLFPGGDIGTLAINGTVNDLAMCGARRSG